MPPKLEIVVEDRLVRPQPQKRKIVSKCDSGERGVVHQGPETGQTHVRLDLSEQSNVKGVALNTSDTELKLTHGMKSIIHHFYVKQMQNDNHFSPSSVQRASKIIELEESSVGQASSQIIDIEHINTMSSSSPAVSDLMLCKSDKTGDE